MRRSPLQNDHEAQGRRECPVLWLCWDLSHFQRVEGFLSLLGAVSTRLRRQTA